jgi:hypothetical protein
VGASENPWDRISEHELISMIRVPAGPSRRNTIWMPRVRRRLCARRSRPASVLGVFGQSAFPCRAIPSRRRSDALPLQCLFSAMIEPT